MHKTGDFMALEQAANWLKSTPNIYGFDEFCLYTEAGQALFDLAEKISERDTTDTDLWNGLIYTLATVAAGTDDIPDRATVGRVRQAEKEARSATTNQKYFNNVDEIKVFEARKIEDTKWVELAKDEEWAEDCPF
jgi:hypothetical protein